MMPIDERRRVLLVRNPSYTGTPAWLPGGRLLGTILIADAVSEHIDSRVQ